MQTQNHTIAFKQERFGLVWTIKTPKINNIENPNIRCFLHPFVSFQLFEYSIWHILIQKDAEAARFKAPF